MLARDSMNNLHEHCVAVGSTIQSIDRPLYCVAAGGSFVVDVWDGTDLIPVVTHGFTLTSKLRFAEVIQVVDKYAFYKTK